jgi:hypothetical protein
MTFTRIYGLGAFAFWFSTVFIRNIAGCTIKSACATAGWMINPIKCREQFECHIDVTFDLDCLTESSRGKTRATRTIPKLLALKISGVLFSVISTAVPLTPDGYAVADNPSAVARARFAVGCNSDRETVVGINNVTNSTMYDSVPQVRSPLGCHTISGLSQTAKHGVGKHLTNDVTRTHGRSFGTIDASSDWRKHRERLERSRAIRNPS